MTTESHEGKLLESQERRRLRELESEGKWVFHGSGTETEILEPRQAHNYPSSSTEEKIPDDKPAVFASPSADIAIFMAIVNKNNAPKGARSGFSKHGDEPTEFRITKDTLDQIHNAKGYVYVFEKDGFISRSPNEVLSYQSVKPSEVVTVTEKDLPENIVIKDF